MVCCNTLELAFHHLAREWSGFFGNCFQLHTQRRKGQNSSKSMVHCWFTVFIRNGIVKSVYMMCLCEQSCLISDAILQLTNFLQFFLRRAACKCTIDVLNRCMFCLFIRMYFSLSFARFRFLIAQQWKLAVCYLCYSFINVINAFELSSILIFNVVYLFPMFFPLIQKPPLSLKRHDIFYASYRLSCIGLDREMKMTRRIQKILREM